MENEVRSLRSAKFTLFVCAVMTWGWGVLLLGAIERVSFALIYLLPLVVCLPLLALAFNFSRNLRGLTGPKLFTNARVVWLYIIGILVTVFGYALAFMLARALHHPEYVIPGATIALGLHFLFLALAFHEKRNYLTLAVFCLTAILVPLLVPLQFALGSLETLSKGGGWMVVTGIVGIVWLAFVAIRLFISGKRRIRGIKSAPENNSQVIGQAG